MENNCSDIKKLTPSYDRPNAFPNPADILTSQLILQAQYDELESHFLMKNYPPFCQKLHYYIDRYLNSEDYAFSCIYDGYPSSATIDHIVDIIYMEIKDDAPNTFREFDQADNFRYTRRGALDLLIRPLLLNELYKRRMRKFVYTLCHTPPMIGNPL